MTQADHRTSNLNRRKFLKTAAVAAGAPAIVPSSVFGANAPSNRITFGCIGVGRMGLGDIRDLRGHSEAQIVAVCDVDSNRTANAKRYVEDYYAQRQSGGTYSGCTGFGDYRELIARDDIDAVQICTPDHWHALPAIEAARAGKDIFLQKPLTLTIPEGRVLSDTVRRYGRVFQVGSQQRSDRNFRFACELVRNGRIGKVHTVKVGFGKDPFTGPQPVMPVPDSLDYEMWLGPAPWSPYTERRVHPQEGYSRPGWLRIQDYCCGMITGWGSHHNDIAQWGLGTMYTGPTQVTATADYSPNGLWDVHGAFRIEYTYPDGTKLIVADNRVNPQGVTFEGENGTVYVRRGRIDANPKSLLTSVIGPNETHLYESRNHKGNFLECIKTRRETVAPVEIGHRSNSVCIIGYIAMKLQGQMLTWDPDKEEFVGNDEANRLRVRQLRGPWIL